MFGTFTCTWCFRRDGHEHFKYPRCWSCNARNGKPMWGMTAFNNPTYFCTLSVNGHIAQVLCKVRPFTTPLPTTSPIVAIAFYDRPAVDRFRKRLWKNILAPHANDGRPALSGAHHGREAGEKQQQRSVGENSVAKRSCLMIPQEVQSHVMCCVSRSVPIHPQA